MDSNSVTSKGQVTIPKAIRQQLGIRQGSRIAFSVEGAQAVLRVVSVAAPTEPPERSGFGLLRSRRKAVPTDFDPASVLSKP